MPDGAVLEPLVECAVDVLELPFPRFEDRLDAGFDLGVACLLLSVEFGGPPLDELPSSGEKLRQFQGVFLGERPERWPNGEPQVSQHAGIHGIRLGELSGRFGEVPCWSRVDDDDGQLGGGPFGDEQLFDASRGLDHDEAGRALLELFAERFDPCGGVFESSEVLSGVLVEIAVLLGNVHAHGKAFVVPGRRNKGWNGRWGTGGTLNGIRHENTLPCRSRLGNAALATVRAQLQTGRSGSSSPTASGTRGSGISRPP